MLVWSNRQFRVLGALLFLLGSASILASALSLSAEPTPNQSESKKEKEDKKKKPEPFKIQKLTQGFGLYLIGPLSPDGRKVLLLGQKPDSAPNLYLMDAADHSIKPPLTSFKLGVTDPAWSPDGSAVVFGGMNESSNFPKLYLLDVQTAKARQLTISNFADKEPAFSPDGKRIIYTTDESPLPDAAFGILHVASVAAAGSKAGAFTVDEGSSIHPGLAADGKSVLLVKVDEQSGRHSLWQYGFDGKAQRDISERRFARIHAYIPKAAGIIVWAQEEPEQEENIYILDPKTGEATALPEPDVPKHNPSVSPDGKLVAFIGGAETGNQLFVYDSASGEVKQITNKGSNTYSPLFVTNQQIIFGSDRERDKEIYLVDLSQAAQEEKKKK